MSILVAHSQTTLVVWLSFFGLGEMRIEGDFILLDIFHAIQSKYQKKYTNDLEYLPIILGCEEHNGTTTA
ncbi:MAG: hypothetical protein LEGION0403_FIIPPAGN_00645 [Legionella sp.]|uniref:hypothetical protein n=1 Tax=Legionella sp. TaxID=459 RepID=UPI003D122349